MHFSGYQPCIMPGKSLKRFGKFRVLSSLGLSLALVRKATMAPKSLLKKLKFKPLPQLVLDVPVVVEKEKLSEWVKPKPVIPEPTPQELVAWTRARELQKVDEAGNPAEGWRARIEAMKADRRLWYCEEDGMWHRRGIEG
jgi:hypothetical protein